MHLSELNPKLQENGEFLFFDCPCKGHKIDLPIGSQPNAWKATEKENLEKITIMPSLKNHPCGQHFFIRTGEIIFA